MSTGSRLARFLARITLGVVALAALALTLVWFQMVRMPGASAAAELPPLTAEETATATRLRELIATGFGKERHLAQKAALDEAQAFVERSLRSAGLTPSLESFTVDGQSCANVVVELPGTTLASEIVIVGAHYDSAEGAPGANDNGSGAASLLELARSLAKKQFPRRVRFVAFANEEPPNFRKADRMGSRIHARRSREKGERVAFMLSLETMGYFSSTPGSQKYPFPFSLYYPDRGDFIGFVSSLDSAPFVRRVVGAFRERATLPSQGGALPARLPGVGWSDHESFTLLGVPALMITDTAPFRYPHYHTAEDTPDKVDADRLARVVVALRAVVEDLATR